MRALTNLVLFCVWFTVLGVPALVLTIIYLLWRQQ